MKIITRIAPSPTGKFHLGTARIALINALFTAKHGGKMYLRIDDTDTNRNNNLYINDIINCLDSFGIKYADIIHQSANLANYADAIDLLFNKGLAYKLDDGAICFAIPKDILISWDDAIHGKITINSNTLIGNGNFIIARKDGTPLYHLASVVDDINMGITHIIRGDDHLTNTAKHILLFNALDATIPTFAHIPLLLGKGGKKLSKRDGTGSISDLIAAGYLPDAIANYLLSLGWSYPYNDIYDIAPSPAFFDIDKLKDINKSYIKKMSNDNLLSLIDNKFPDNLSRNTKLDAIALFKDNLTLLGDADNFINDLFNPSITDDAKNLLATDDAKDILNILYNGDDIDRNIILLLNKYSKPTVFKTIRASIIGKTSGFDAIDLLKFILKYKN